MRALGCIAVLCTVSSACLVGNSFHALARALLGTHFATVVPARSVACAAVICSVLCRTGLARLVGARACVAGVAFAGPAALAVAPLCLRWLRATEALVVLAAAIPPALLGAWAAGGMQTAAAQAGPTPMGVRECAAGCVVVGCPLLMEALVGPLPLSRAISTSLALACVLAAAGGAACGGRNGSAAKTPARAWLHSGACVVALAAVGVALAHAPPSPPSHLRVLETVESEGGSLAVVEDVRQGYRFLKCDHSVLGGLWLHTPHPESIFGTFHLQEAAHLAVRPRGSGDGNPPRALVVGLGIGVAPTALRRLGYRVQVVELDAAVVRAASRWFGFSPASPDMAGSERAVVVGDVDRVATSPQGFGLEPPFDLIVHDVFSGGAMPDFLLSEQALGRVAALLSPSPPGVLCVSVWGSTRAGRSEGTEHVVRALATLLGNVRVFVEGGAQEEEENGSTNVVVLASASHLEFRPLADMAPQQGGSVRAQVLQSLHAWEVHGFVERATAARGQPEGQGSRAANARDHWETMNQVFGYATWAIV